MKTLIFVPSTILFRGLWLAPKAGLFHFRAKGVFYPISGGLPLPSAKKRIARESGLVDSGIRQAAFLSAYVNQSHNAHRNQVPRRPAELPRTPDHSGTISETRRRNGAEIEAFTPRFYSTKPGAFRARFQPIICLFSVT